MASLNITSFAKHIDELRVFLNDQNIDILAINETRLNERISDRVVKVQGYDTIRRDRSTNGRFGGGVCFYIRSNILMLKLLVETILSSTDLDSQLLEIISTVITSWYKPPNSPHEYFSHISTLLGKLDSENVEYFFMGD